MANPFQEGQLAQQVGTASAVSMLTAAADTTYLIKNIRATNNTGAPVDIFIYHDTDGTTYDNTTLIFVGTLQDKQVFTDDSFFSDDGENTGNIAILGNGITFTIYGATVTR